MFKNRSLKIQLNLQNYNIVLRIIRSLNGRPRASAHQNNVDVPSLQYVEQELN
jgi:hypothetical protein